MKKSIFNVKLVLTLITALLIFSCDGEDGMDGLNGIDGIDGSNGIDGTDGTNGVDGEDGNANVFASPWITADFPDAYSFSAASVTVTDSQLTQEVLNTYSILGYFSFDENYSSIYAIPFTEPLLRSFDMQMRAQVGEIIVTELGNLDTVGTIAPIDGFFRYILLAPSNTGKSNNKNSIQSLKEAGVDTNDYYAVMDYFGLEY